MSKDEKIVKVLQRVIPIMSILTVFVFIMIINKKSYALFTKHIDTDIMIHIVTADEMPFRPGFANDIVKGTIEKEGGIIGLDPTTGEICSNGECKEYRYSGRNVNNYIYFNCEEGATKEDASSKCELWRIVGVFKDEDGSEHLKIVRNNVVDNKVWDSESPYSSNWEGLEIETYLNTEYYGTLTANAKSMIAEKTKYYLGNFKYGSSVDTAISSYTNERGNEECSGSCSGGDVWAGNEATWPGKIALLYPSDYGFTADKTYWDKLSLYDFDTGPSETSWLQESANHSTNEWLLSPSSGSPYYVTYWNESGSVNTDIVYNSKGIRPSLNLISEAKIIDGNGSKDKPYFMN